METIFFLKKHFFFFFFFFFFFLLFCCSLSNYGYRNLTKKRNNLTDFSLILIVSTKISSCTSMQLLSSLHHSNITKVTKLLHWTSRSPVEQETIIKTTIFAGETQDEQSLMGNNIPPTVCVCVCGINKLINLTVVVPLPCSPCILKKINRACMLVPSILSN